MEMESFIYCLFCAMCLGGGLGVLALRGFVNSAMSMLVSMLGVAGLLLLMRAYFLAFVMVTVYAGAVLVLFVFVVMLIGDRREDRSFLSKFMLLALWAAMCACLAFFEPQITAAGMEASSAGASLEPGSILALSKNYGYFLFTKFLLPFEIAGLMLLAAMIGVIVIARLKRAGNTKA